MYPYLSKLYLPFTYNSSYVIFVGFVDAADVCCGYHEYDIHVYCGNKGNINGTETYVGSCKDPARYISWDGVHNTEAANNWITNRILDGSLSDPPLPITHACS